MVAGWYDTLIRKPNLILLAILTFGLVLRFWGIGFGLPYMYHPDEGVPVGIALNVLRTGNLNPEFYHWPSLLFYLNALVYFGYFLVGRSVGRFASPSDLPYPDVEIMGVGKTALPDELVLGRGLSALVGALSIVFVYLIAQQFRRGRAISLVAALFMAVDPVSVRNSQLIRPDTLAILFSLVSVLFAIKIIDEPRLRNYVLAAVGAGLAASSKYNAAIVFVTVIAAHLARFQWRGIIRKEIYLAGLVSELAFFAATPYAILDASRFIQIGPMDDARNYSSGHPGVEGDTLSWYVNFLWTTLGLVLLFALAEMAATVFRREKKKLVLLGFPLVYFAFINLYTVHFESTILPVIPFLLIFAALFLARIHDYAIQRWSNSRIWASAALIAVAAVLVLPPLRATAANNARLLEWDGREYARQWIDANLPTGSRIALEAYSPYVDREKFVVAGFYGLADQTPDWYVSQGYEYLVFSQGTYGRYFADPQRYGMQIDLYNAFFSRFPLIAQFDENGFQIRIYRTNVTLPAHRVAARFGNYGEIIELVGYDGVEQSPGGSLTLNLYWRPLSDVVEPLELEIRMLAADDREAAKVRADLFQGKGWQNQLFETRWHVSLPDGTPSGDYRLQLTVVQTRFSYRLPTKNWTSETIDPLLLGPFKIE